MRLEYTVEIVPNQASEAPLKSHLYHRDKSKLFFLLDEVNWDKYSAQDSFNDAEINEYSQTFFCPTSNEKDGCTKKDDKIKDEQKMDHKFLEAKIVISTEINGRTIAQTSEKIPPPPRYSNYEQLPHVVEG